MERGAAVFRESCSSCHGATGLGVPVAGGTMAPALSGSPRVTGHPNYVINVLLHGLTGPIEGHSYAGQIMVSQAQQPDEWIADIASYVRNAFTNTASFITPQQVAAIRASTSARTTAWTYPELARVVPQLMHQQATWKATASHNRIARSARSAPRDGHDGAAGAGDVVPVRAPEPTTLTELRFHPRRGGPPGPAPRPMPYARGYKVQVSMDGTTWSEPVAEGAGAAADVDRVQAGDGEVRADHADGDDVRTRRAWGDSAAAACTRSAALASASDQRVDQGIKGQTPEKRFAVR
jgi:hypothetical protein